MWNRYARMWGWCWKVGVTSEPINEGDEMKDF
jgi:hypothetical protein